MRNVMFKWMLRKCIKQLSELLGYYLTVSHTPIPYDYDYLPLHYRNSVELMKTLKVLFSQINSQIRD